MSASDRKTLDGSRRGSSNGGASGVATVTRLRLFSFFGIIFIVLVGCYNFVLIKSISDKHHQALHLQPLPSRQSASSSLRSQLLRPVETKAVDESPRDANPSKVRKDENTNNQIRITPKPKATIAYLTSITACPSDRQNYIDAAAVLKHSIHKVSVRNPDSGSVYDYAMFAVIHTQAAACRADLERVGYRVLLRDTPFGLDEIQNEAYVNRLINPNAGCCQEKEFLKLYAYTMHDYPLAVHLDMDFVVLRPMDILFDPFFLPDDETKYIRDAMFPADRQWTGRMETMFTRDYPMGHPGREPAKVGMQGGFWIVRPNQTAFDELVAIIKQGNFNAGWYDGNVKYPGFYGAAMIQGLIGFFYGHYHPGQLVELDRCVHNQMVDTNQNEKGECFSPPIDGTCRDCRVANATDIYSAHFTFCGKPVSFRNDIRCV